MTEREKLFLYHGVCIGAAGEGGKPPGRVTPLMNEIGDAPMNLKQEIAEEIREAVLDAERRLAAKN